jgi:3-oxoacyl-[acyl-carrier protein] reductase
MINVVETWRIREEFTDRLTKIMQEMDDLVGPAAHADPAWAGHATFLQPQQEPTTVWMLYRWRSRAEHEQLAVAEEEILNEFYAKYCWAPREIDYLNELPVDVEHDHDG